MTQTLDQKIAAAEQITIMLESNAWTQYVGPLIDRMITDVVGGKENGRWLGTPPKLNERTIPTEEFRFLLGYKASLIDFLDGVYGIIEEAEDAKEAERIAKNTEENYPSTYGD